MKQKRRLWQSITNTKSTRTTQTFSSSWWTVSFTVLLSIVLINVGVLETIIMAQQQQQQQQQQQLDDNIYRMMPKHFFVARTHQDPNSHEPNQKNKTSQLEDVSHHQYPHLDDEDDEDDEDEDDDIHSDFTSAPLFSDTTHRRFPVFGSTAFDQICAGHLGFHSSASGDHGSASGGGASGGRRTDTIQTQSSPSPCTILVQPQPKDSEGISQWLCKVVVGFQQARRGRRRPCQFLLQYYPQNGIQVSQILQPPEAASLTWNSSLDWRVPRTDFECRKEDSCQLATGGNFYRRAYQNWNASIIVPPPSSSSSLSQRIMSSSSLSSLLQQQQQRRDAAPATTTATTKTTIMACTLGALFRLAPTAALFQPNLFDFLLPTLQQDLQHSVVLSLYIRTGHTEHVLQAETTMALEKYVQQAQRIIQCAMQVEQIILNRRMTMMMMTNTSASTTPPPRRRRRHVESFRQVVWMVVTDSPKLKEWIRQQYNDTTVTMANTNNQSWAPAATTTTTTTHSLRRIILTTNARGAHTRGRFNNRHQNNVSMVDFAQGILDWYLIGESDAVISDSYSKETSFGDTATLRTVRPYFKVPPPSRNPQNSTQMVWEKCQRVYPVFR